MDAIDVRLTGNVGSEVEQRTVGGGAVTWFRVASTRRYYDRGQRAWVDGATSWLDVYCWRELGEHVASSIRKGDPVLVVGRLTVREWEREGRRGKAVEVEASAVGHDLGRGTSAFQRRKRARPGSDAAGGFEDFAVSRAMAADDGVAAPPAADRGVTV